MLSELKLLYTLNGLSSSSNSVVVVAIVIVVVAVVIGVISVVIFSTCFECLAHILFDLTSIVTLGNNTG
jgi:uncharacterized membrane protein